MLAPAHKIEDAIRRGVVRDRAEAARRLGLTRSRVTQLLDLTLLAPEIQEELLELESVDGVEPICEYRIRAVAHAGTWDQQRERWTEVTAEEEPRRSMTSSAPSGRDC
jgi:ParB-like chromosome segregation protein Spo0J